MPESSDTIVESGIYPVHDHEAMTGGGIARGVGDLVTMPALQAGREAWQRKGGRDVCQRSDRRIVGLDRACSVRSAPRLRDDQHESHVPDRRARHLDAGDIFDIWLIGAEAGRSKSPQFIDDAFSLSKCRLNEPLRQ